MSSSGPDVSWAIEHHTGSAADFHARPMPDHPRRAVWWFHVDRPALVLGSTQRDEVVDLDAAAAAGVEIVRRRSGGGAVLLEPGAVSWVDVIVPAGDPLWDDDVGRSVHWLGHTWAAVLQDSGVSGHVHEGPLQASRWSGLVCFAGLGAGEVTVDGRKAVGISQRRTRAAARFQCAVVHRWEPERLVPLLRLDATDRGRLARDLATRVHPVQPSGQVLEQRLVGHLPS